MLSAFVNAFRTPDLRRKLLFALLFNVPRMLVLLTFAVAPVNTG